MAGWFITDGKSIYKWMITGGTPISGKLQIWFNCLTMENDQKMAVSGCWGGFPLPRSSVPASQARPTPTSRRTQKEVPKDAGTWWKKNSEREDLPCSHVLHSGYE